MLFPRVHVLDRGDAKQPPVLVAILRVAFGIAHTPRRSKGSSQVKVLLSIKAGPPCMRCLSKPTSVVKL